MGLTTTTRGKPAASRIVFWTGNTGRSPKSDRTAASCVAPISTSSHPPFYFSDHRIPGNAAIRTRDRRDRRRARAAAHDRPLPVQAPRVRPASVLRQIPRIQIEASRSGDTAAKRSPWRRIGCSPRERRAGLPHSAGQCRGHWGHIDRGGADPRHLVSDGDRNASRLTRAEIEVSGIRDRLDEFESLGDEGLVLGPRNENGDLVVEGQQVEFAGAQPGARPASHRHGAWGASRNVARLCSGGCSL